MKILVLFASLCWSYNSPFVWANYSCNLSNHNYQQLIDEDVSPHIEDRMQQLPTDSDTWETFHTEKKAYVDKTKFLLYFVKYTSKLYISCKPRRFGKTLFLQMVQSFFRAEKHHFKGTCIFKYGNTPAQNGSWIRYPVIYLDFGFLHFDCNVVTPVNETMRLLKRSMESRLRSLAKKNKIDITKYENDVFTLDLLIDCLDTEFNLPIVLLIDEYDRIINKVIKASNKDLADNLLGYLDTFYGQIKSASAMGMIKFAWVTGVHKYAIDEFQSGPNSFTDLSWDPKFATSVGFTKDEIQTTFKSQISEFAANQSKTTDDIMKEMNFWYDGYSFSENIFDSNNNVYNLVSVITALRKFKFAPYWSNTASCDYIIRQMYNKSYGIKCFENFKMTNFDWTHKYTLAGGIPLPHYMLHTGYLKIISYDNNHAVLNYPNNEIKIHLKKKIDKFFPGPEETLDSKYCSDKIAQLGTILTQSPRNITNAVNILNDLGFPSFEHPLHQSVCEYDVTRRISILLRLAGINHTNVILQQNDTIGKKKKFKKSSQTKGDIDLFTTLLPINYVMEIKVGYNPKKSYMQLLGYFMNEYNTFRRYITNEKIYLLTLNFSKEKNNKIESWALIPCINDKMLQHQITASSAQLSCEIQKYITEKQPNNSYSEQTNLNSSSEFSYSENS